MRRQNLRVLRSFGLDQVRQLASCKTLENSPGAAKKLHHSIRLERAPPLATPRTPGCSQRAAPPLLARKWELPAWEAARNTLSTGLQLGAALHAAATRRRPVFHTGAVGGVRRGATCWASRRFILGFLAIQRVDGPSLAMLTHPSNSSCFLGQIRPGPSSCRAGHLAGVFFATPRRVLVRAAARITRLRGPPWRRHSGTTPRSGGAAGSRIP